MAYTLVQSPAVANGSGTTLAKAFASNVTAHSLLVAYATTDGAGGAITFTSPGATWADIASFQEPGSGQWIAIGWCLDAPSGATTVTATFGGTPAFNGLILGELSAPGGVASTLHANTTGKLIAAGTTSTPTDNSLTASSGDAVISILISAAATTITAGSTFTILQNDTTDVGAAEYLLSASGTLSPSFAVTGTPACAIMSASFSPAGGAAAPPPLPFAPGKTWRRRFKHQQILPPAGVTGPQAYTQSLTGGLSFAGARNGVVSKGQTGGLTFVGAENNRTSTTRTGGLSFVGAISRRISKTITGGLSFVGAQARAVIHGFTAGLTFVGAVTKRTTTSRTGSLSFAGALTKSTLKSAFTGALSFIGAFSTAAVHQFTQAISGALSFVGAQTRRTASGRTGALSFVGAQTRSVGHGLTGALSFVGAQARAVRTGLAAALSFVGSLTKRTTHAFTAALTFVGALTTSSVHFFTQALTGGLSFVGAHSKRAGKALTGGLSFSGAPLVRRVGHGMTGAVSFTGNVSRGIRTRLASALSFIGDLTKSGTGIPTVPVPPARILIVYAELRVDTVTAETRTSQTAADPRTFTVDADPRIEVVPQEDRVVPAQYLKDSNATLDYGINWAPWLGADTITASAWTVQTGLTIATPAASFTTTTTTIWLSGGTVGTTYTVTNRVTTAAGRIDDRTFTVEVIDR